MASVRNSENSGPTKRVLAGQLLAYATVVAIVVPVEFDRIKQITANPPEMGAANPKNPEESGQEQQSPSGQDGWATWILDFNVDTTPYLVLFLLAPAVWLIRRPLFRRKWSWLEFMAGCLRGSGGDRSPDESSSVLSAWVLGLSVAAVSCAVSLRVASQPIDGERPSTFGQLPPAYHDEYSYLFQARTFLAGRLWFPSHATAPRLFDQMHVLNEGRFASRYFPGVGAWIAPWLYLNVPYWGHWLAGAVASLLVFWTGRELANNGVGLIAGLLTALSPGMALFSNLLLSHHPTLVGLSLFLFAFVRMQRTCRARYALLSGVGLSFAMLCRPMTAAGFGLPFGLWFLWWLVRGDGTCVGSTRRFRTQQAFLLVIPILAGIGTLFAYNRSITGSVLTTPYHVYTETYTPRHVYGFNNVVRGEQHLGPRVIDNYDHWAKNLTPSLAIKNVQNRLIASWQWTLGIIPLSAASIVFVFGAGHLDRRWWFIPAAIVSMHVVHIPYWFDGIMHWHYVFETGPLWCLLFAAATFVLISCWRTAERTAMNVWWAVVVAVAVMVSHIPLDPFWRVSLLEVGTKEIAFSRTKYDEFQRTIRQAIGATRALVLIVPDPDDRHMDLVINDPSLQANVLFGRVQSDMMQFDEIAREFPDRDYYLYRAESQRLLAIELHEPRE